MCAKRNYRLEDISKRRNKWNIDYFNYTNNLSLGSSLEVYQSGHKRFCPPNFLCGPATYDHCIIHYIFDGCGTYHNSQGDYEVGTHDAFLILPYETVTYESDSQNPWKYYWIGFNGPNAIQMLSLCGFSEENRVVHFDCSERLLSLFDAVTHCEDTGIALECHLTGYLYEIFSAMIAANQTRISSAYAEHFYKAQQYIKMHYDDSSLSVSSIADYIGINRSHLYKVFDQIAHQSVSSYILDFRLKKAASLLKNSSAKIGEIANSCGFSEQSYFSNVFQRRYGVSPSLYRKNPPETKEDQNSISIPS